MLTPWLDKAAVIALVVIAVLALIGILPHG